MDWPDGTKDTQQTCLYRHLGAYTWRTIGKNKWEKRPKEERVPIQIPVIMHQPLFDSVQQKLQSRQAGRTQTNYRGRAA